MMFRMTIKEGPRVLYTAAGKERSEEHVTVEDLRKVIETEQFLEHLLGLRVHIDEV